MPGTTDIGEPLFAGISLIMFSADDRFHCCTQSLGIAFTKRFESNQRPCTRTPC